MLKRFCQYYILIALINPSWIFAVSSTSVPPQLYKVEIIVFAHVTPKGLLSEQWSENPVLPMMNHVYDLQSIPQQTAALSNPDLVPTVIKPSAYQILPVSYFELVSEAEKLTVENNYPLLIHVAWLQPGLPIRNSRRIHIYGGQAYDMNGQPLTDVSPLNVNSGNVILPAPNGNKQWQLNGYVRVSQPYLFQLHANLVLTIPSSLLQQILPAAAAKLQTNQFVLQQTFRMKLGQLYYIDHPLFGILAKITKYSVTNKTTL